MFLHNLQIHNFRNITHCDVTLAKKFNIFYGANGAGKTSLLEAIYFLAHYGKSFRTQQAVNLIQHAATELSVFIGYRKNDIDIPFGIQKTMNGSKTVKINGNKAASFAEVSRHLPTQFIGVDSHRLFCDGPTVRRQFIDRGLFHVEQRFLAVWQQIQKTLKQRNAALKQKTSRREIIAWDGELSHLSHQLDNMRSHYVAQLKPYFETLIKIFLPEVALNIYYERGWPLNVTLAEILSKNFSRDYSLGYTYYGAQRADFCLKFKNIAISDILSQGQQKLTAYALLLAQGQLLQRAHGQGGIYLIDDLPSELDSEKRTFLLAALIAMNAQVFITSILAKDLADCSSSDSQVFHVEQGHIKISDSF